MKQAAMVMVLLLATGLCAQEQKERGAFDLFGGISWGRGLGFSVNGDGSLSVSGRTEGGTAGYVVESRDPLEFSSARTLIIRVSGLTGDEQFDLNKLCKVELNNVPQRTVTAGMTNRNDRDYLNARNGEAVFDLSKLQNIRKFNLVFFNCQAAGFKIEVFYE